MSSIPKRGHRRAKGRERDEINLGALTDLAGYAIKRAQEHVFETFMAATPDTNITPARLAALTMISANENLTPTDLAETLRIARSGATAMLKALHDIGYVTQSVVDTDRRAVRLSLTPAGRLALDAVTKAVQKQDEELTASLTTEERETLLSLLDRICS